MKHFKVTVIYEAEAHEYVVIDCVTFESWEEQQAWLAANPVPF